MRSFSGLVASVALALTAPLINAQQQVCNGRAEFCSRSYSNVTLIGAHDSAFVGPIIDPRVNQEVDITGQLNAGIRYFEVQTHVLNNVISLCHTSCLELYAGPLSDYLTSVKTWLDGHPDDIVTILVANGDSVNATTMGSVFNATGISEYAFVPSTSPNMLSINDWPTYSSMISAGQRLVVFMDYHADEREVPYILDEFTYYFETPYDTTDPEFAQCEINRPDSAGPDGRMYIVNHFLDTNFLNTGILIPDNFADAETNAAKGNGSIGAQADLCYSIYGRPPNVVLVDMFDRGDVFTAQNNLNNLS